MDRTADQVVDCLSDRAVVYTLDPVVECTWTDASALHEKATTRAWATGCSRPFEHAVRPANNNAPIERRERLGRLLNFYYRRAA